MLTINCSMDILLDAAKFYARALGIEHYSAEVEIVWIVNNNLLGYCGDEGNGCYEIGVAPDGLETLETLAHEFVHLYQYLTGALRDIGRDKVIYLDTIYPYTLDDQDVYRALPFEAEAFERQEPLMIAFVKWYHEQGKI